MKGFTLVDAPIFTPNACEGSTTLFETDYFDQKAYLSQSGQLYMEAAACPWEPNPMTATVFPSRTPRLQSES